jgi:hypothetical protein
MTAQIERLPGPYWAPYLIGLLVVLGAGAALASLTGGALSVRAVYNLTLPLYGFWLLHYLDRKAAGALQEYRPAFVGGEAEIHDIRWRLTTLPAVPALGLTLMALLVGLAVSTPWGWSPASQVLDRIAFIVTVVFAVLYAYHSLRQLRLVTRLYADRTRVDLHAAGPVYAFSTLSAHTAMGMLFLLSGAVVITPDGLVGGWLTGAIAFAALAVLAFLLPLMGLHRRLAEAKDAELVEIGRRWQVCMAEVYRCLDAGEMEAVHAANTALSALERGRVAIERIPTWPWRAETLRSLVAALILPVILSVLQYALRRTFG